jgi:hypothetical protein
VLPRIWILLLAALLLAAPADDVQAEVVDVTHLSPADEEALTRIEVALFARPADRAGAPPPRDLVPPSPLLSRVFRPPRPSFD